MHRYHWKPEIKVTIQLRSNKLALIVKPRFENYFNPYHSYKSTEGCRSAVTLRSCGLFDRTARCQNDDVCDVMKNIASWLVQNDDVCDVMKNIASWLVISTIVDCDRPRRGSGN